MRNTTGVSVSLFLVMAGLDPATPGFASHWRAGRGCVDARNTSGHDICEIGVTEVLRKGIGR